MVKNFVILKSLGADYYFAWAYWLPKKFLRFRKYFLFWPGKIPIIKKFGMNYYILAQKKY